ncbi:MAG: RNA polymerase sigma-54 factor [Devosia sp. 67-54]|uniref:RNA polymerase factor sigma-54 n=1 Tax=unclassified Devosia TaxID=196773 RepID=UPI0009682151|nr:MULTISPECIES: RNA polymerase factor sigma-54 [unclassified Devosia]MBN9304976.1 RNA polymerase factor sigma-54 [Devosia sp.]OJX15081.1 MAG: RNA polymerase sigma-54 factor [Devosia sp. 67-54]
MALSPRLEVRQSQSLTLTPQLMQSIRLLQLSHLELSAFVDAELLRNPLLEREDGTEPVETPEPAPEITAHDDAVDAGERIQDADGIAQSFDTEVDNVFPEQRSEDRLESGWSGGSLSDPGEAADIDQYVAARPTLADHLNTQIGLLLDDPVERLIARFLADGLNEAGYLTLDLDTVSQQLGAPLAAVEAVLARLQTLDPPGLFARSVPECLAIQLRERDRLDPLMQRLLDHLELIASHDLAALARAVGADRDDLADMLAELRALDPKPGRAFERGPVEAVVPDVFVREGPAGWIVELNSDILPRVLVNRTYYATVTGKTRDSAEKAFLVDCLQTANWLAKSLDQRAQTILKVATEIVRQQDAFLNRGIAFLRPMTLKLVADAIDMHESTVSRVTSNKYIATPRGLFEMKYFFTTALASSTGDADHSAEAVRHRIRQLIDAESPADILSDDTIADMLHKEQGIEVARRTVAKYREGMNIPSSVIRRRQKRALVAAR